MDKKWTPEQLKIIDTLRDKIKALCDSAIALPQDVGVSGFVFEPDSGLVLHFGNISFPFPQQILSLHQVLAVSVIRAALEGDAISEKLSPATDLVGATSPEIKDSGTEQPPNEFALADELAKLVLMLPTSETSPEAVAAARTYFESRVRDVQDKK